MRLCFKLGYNMYNATWYMLKILCARHARHLAQPFSSNKAINLYYNNTQCEMRSTKRHLMSTNDKSIMIKYMYIHAMDAQNFTWSVSQLGFSNLCMKKFLMSALIDEGQSGYLKQVTICITSIWPNQFIVIKQYVALVFDLGQQYMYVRSLLPYSVLYVAYQFVDWINCGLGKSNYN